jgi:hypothetical protein
MGGVAPDVPASTGVEGAEAAGALDAPAAPASGDGPPESEQAVSTEPSASAAMSTNATSPSLRLGLGAVNAPPLGSSVGALAVVGGLLLATAALASGLAHGDLLVDRPVQCRSRVREAEIGRGPELPSAALQVIVALAEPWRVTSLEGADLRRVSGGRQSSWLFLSAGQAFWVRSP